MSKFRSFYKNIKGTSKPHLCILALFVCCVITAVSASSVFATFNTQVVGVGTTPVATWNFGTAINGDSPTNGMVENINIAGDASHPYNRDVSATVTPYYAAPGTAGYVPVLIDGTNVQISLLVTVTASFDSLPEMISFTDNLGNEIGIKNNAISYSYYFSYAELSVWNTSCPGIPIDIGFRWAWDASDTSSETQVIAKRVSVTGRQISNNSDIAGIPSVHFASSVAQFKYGSFLNVLFTDITSSSPIEVVPTGDFALDLNGHTIGNDFTVTSDADININIGTRRHYNSDPGTINGDLTIVAPNAHVNVGTNVVGDINANTSASSFKFTGKFVDVLNAERLGCINISGGTYVAENISERAYAPNVSAVQDGTIAGSKPVVIQIAVGALCGRIDLSSITDEVTIVNNGQIGDLVLNDNDGGLAPLATIQNGGKILALSFYNAGSGTSDGITNADGITNEVLALEAQTRGANATFVD